MPTFGQYETAQRLFLSGVGGLYTLKSDDKKVIKVLQPPLGIWADDRIQEEIDAFRLRGKTQKALAKTSKFWAPIHNVAAIRAGTEGSSGGGEAESTGDSETQRPPAGGAFVVMDRYERSAQSLIDGRVNLLNADLRHIMSGVIAGLLDIKKSGRPHGNLKPSNILLNNSADLAAATVHVTDPLADGALAPAMGEKDLTDLGRILYLLVNLRTYDGGTIPRTRDWDDLGPNGEDWRKLCNALIDPHTPAVERDLEKILPVIDTWRLKPKKSKAPMLITAAAIVLIAGGIVTYIVTRPPPVQWDQERWNVLNLEYQGWFKDFSDQMYNKVARDKFRKPPYPEEIVRLLDAAGDINDFDPAVIAQNKGIEWDARLLNPTPRAMNPGAGPEATKKAVDLITGIEAALTPAKWPLLTRLDETAKRYESYGWQKPADGIRKTIAGARPPEVPEASLLLQDRIKKVEEWKTAHKETVIKSVEQTIIAANAITAIDARWKKIEEELPTLAAGDAANVTLLASLKGFVEELPKTEATEDVASLEAPFTRIEELLKKVSEALQTGGQLDYVALAEDPAAKAAPSMEAYTALAEVLPGYRKLTTDPRAVKEWSTKLASIKSDMINLITEDLIANKKVPADDPALVAINAQFATITAGIEKSAAIRPIAKFQKEIKDSAEEIDTGLTKLYGDAEQHPSYMNQEKFDRFVALQKSKYSDAKQMPPSIAEAAKPVRDKWVAAQTSLLKTVSARSLNEFRGTHVKDEQHFNELERFYANVNQTLTDKDPDRVALLAAFAKDSPWAALAQHVANDYRDSILADLLAKAVKQPENPPQLDSAEYRSLREASYADYQKTCKDSLQLFNDYGTITSRLDRLQLLPNEPAAGNPTFRDLYAKWRDSKSPLVTDASIAAALKPISARVTALLAVDDLKDYAAVLADTQSSSPEIALAAWRKLGTVPVTEEIPALEDETKAQAALGTHLTKLSQAKVLDDAHLQAFNAEIAAQRPIRWHRWTDTVTTTEHLKTALDNVKTFNVSLTPQNDAPMLYYQALFALQDNFAKTPKEDELRAPADKFIATVNGLPDAVSKNADVVALVDRMQKSLKTNTEDTATGAGPQLADWEVDKSKEDQGFRIFHSKDHKFTLEFAKFQVSEADSQKTIFLCTTEMSLGLFIETLNNSNLLGDIDNDKKPPDKQHWFTINPGAGKDTYAASGPRGWRLVGGKFTVNGDWLDFQDPLMEGKPYYPAQATPGKPAPENPMQLISPWSAMFAARLLGCRLPTSDEWTAAYNLFEVPQAGKALPKDIWNLRGENPKGPSWATQQAHGQAMAANGMRYPDAGMFLPGKFTFQKVKGIDAKPWTSDALAKIAPQRITSSPTVYQNSNLWFLDIDKEVPTPAQPLTMHHLVGNVAEYVFDGESAPPAKAGEPAPTPTIASVVKDNKPSAAVIDGIIADKKNAGKLCVIGGSSLSPPVFPFNEKEPINMDSPQTPTGFCDVGFRLAFTAPMENIVDVLATVFKDPKALPGPRMKKG